MGRGTEVGFKTALFLVRFAQIGCAAVVLFIYGAFLISLRENGFGTEPWLWAVVAIAGCSAVYEGLCVCLVCCFAGKKVAFSLAFFFDVFFGGAYIYIAVANRDGANSCKGVVSTPYGSGEAELEVQPQEGEPVLLPTYGTACRSQTMAFSAAIVAIALFVISALNEVALRKYRSREKVRMAAERLNDPKGYNSSQPQGLTQGIRPNWNLAVDTVKDKLHMGNPRGQTTDSRAPMQQVDVPEASHAGPFDSRSSYDEEDYKPNRYSTSTRNDNPYEKSPGVQPSGQGAGRAKGGRTLT